MPLDTSNSEHAMKLHQWQWSKIRETGSWLVYIYVAIYIYIQDYTGKVRKMLQVSWLVNLQDSWNSHRLWVEKDITGTEVLHLLLRGYLGGHHRDAIGTLHPLNHCCCNNASCARTTCTKCGFEHVWTIHGRWVQTWFGLAQPHNSICISGDLWWQSQLAHAAEAYWLLPLLDDSPWNCCWSSILL